MSGMGTFRTTIQVESHTRRGQMTELRNVLVDTGSEATWIPRTILESLGIQPEKEVRFHVAEGRTIERQAGFAIIHIKRRADGRRCRVREVRSISLPAY